MFKEMLEDIIGRTEGSLGALIMGTDGIAVEKVLGEAGVDANLDVAAAEFTSLVRSAQRAGNDTGSVNAPVPAFASPLPSITDPFQSTSTCRSNVAISVSSS